MRRGARRRTGTAYCAAERAVVLVVVGAFALAGLIAIGPQALAAVTSVAVTRVSSGVGPDAASTCPAQVIGGSAHCPGLDTSVSADDQILRTLDTADVKFEVNITGTDTGVQLVSQLPAYAAWTFVPAACSPGSGLATNNTKLTCKLPNSTGSALLNIAATFRLLPSAGDNTTFSVPATVTSAATTGGVTAASAATFTSSATPQWNMINGAFGSGENVYLRTGSFPYRSPDGVAGVAWIQGAAMQGAKGAAKLTEPVTYSWSLDAIPAAIRPQVRLLNWGEYGNGCGPESGGSYVTNPGYTNKSVTLTNQGGTATATSACSQPGGAGTDVSVSMTNINSDFRPFYTWTALWVPVSALPAGTNNLTTTIANFDPTSINGVSNYGGTGADACTGTVNKTGCEPLADNPKAHTVNNVDAYTLSKTLTGAGNPYAYSTQIGSFVGSVDRNAGFASTVWQTNTGTQEQAHPQLCDKFDPSTQRLTDWSVNPPAGLSGVAAGTYTVVTTIGPKSDPILSPAYGPSAAYNGSSNYSVDPGAYVVEYAAGDWSDPAAAPADQTTIANAPCSDANPPTGWHTSFTDPAIEAYAASKGLTPADVVDRVRVTFRQPLLPGQIVAMKTRLTSLSTYRADTSKAGQTILATTPIFGSGANLYDGKVGGWVNARNAYVVITGTLGVQVTIGKSASATTIQAGGAAGADTTTFTLRPVLVLGEDVTDPQPLRVVDLLPPQLRYVTGSASRPPDVVQDLGSTGTLLVWDLGPLSGAPGSTVSPTPITYRAQADPVTPSGTVAKNNVVVQSLAANGTAIDTRPLGSNGGCNGNRYLDVPPTPYVDVTVPTNMPSSTADLSGCFGQGYFARFDQSSITIGNALVLAATKNASVTQVQPGPSTFTWSMRDVNLSATAIPGVDIVDVLPYTGDGRTPASQVSGTLRLSGTPTSTDPLSPAATPNLLPPTATPPFPARNGTTFYYTSAAPASINRDPSADSNLASGSTKWCLASLFGTAGCPAGYGDATALRIISGSLPGGGGEKTVTVPVVVTGGVTGENYSNDAVIRGQGVSAAVSVPTSTVTVAASTIAGTVWRDANGDGVINTGETGRLGGVTVTLSGTDDLGNAISRSTTTAADGTYSFAELRASNAAGYTVTVGPGGLDPADSLTFDPDGPTAAPNGRFTVVLPAFTTRAGQNVGYARQSIAGRVYVDTNNNGAIDPGEVGIAGVTVTLSGTDDKGATVNRTAATAADGSYGFADIRPGTYTLTETQPTVPPYIDGKQTAGTSGGTAGAAGTSVISAITVRPADVALNYLFGELLPPVISGLVYQDVNLNGVYDSGDLGIAGVTITLGGAASRTTTTLSDGSFTFSDLPVGTFTLTETQPPTLVDGTIVAGTKGGTVGTNAVTAIPIVGGDNATGYRFGERRPPPAAPIFTGPAAGLSNVNRPTFTGTAPAGSTVKIYDGSGATPICTTTADLAGNFVCQPTAVLADGPHAITATATQSDGQVSPRSTVLDLRIDTTPPAAPVITAPTDGSYLTNATPIVSGTGEAGAILTVFDGTTALGTVVVGADGRWTLSVLTPLIEGPHTLTSTQTDPAGNLSPVSNAVHVIVDTRPPAAPVITSPITGTVTNNNRPPVAGTGEPGATVSVFDGMTLLGTAVVAGDGSWTLTPTTALSDGFHALSATQKDPAGLVSPRSNGVDITVDTRAPAAPVITMPTPNTVTSDTTPTILGTGEPGATVTIKDGTTLLGTAVVAADGTWTFTPTTALAEGPHSVSATQADPAGNVSPVSNVVPFRVNSATPGAPVITAPVDGTVTRNNTPTITGTGEAGHTVTVLDGATRLGTALVGADGRWTLTPSTALSDGRHTFTATQTNDAGTQSAASPEVSIIVDTVAPKAPVITAPVTGTVTRNNRPTILGTGEPGATVTVLDGATRLGTAVVGADGTWSLVPTTALSDGLHTFTATQADPAGNVSPASAPVAITVDTVAPAAPPITAPAPGSTTALNAPPISGTGEPGATVTVREGTTVVGTAVVAANGTWSFVPATAFPDGPHTLSATQADAAGNVSPVSAEDTFTVDTTVPAAPVITSPSTNTTTNDNTPTVTGTGEPGATVTLLDGTRPLGTALVAPDGTWTFTPTTPLADGPHTFIATQTDPAGNISPASAPVDIVIDTAAPAAPVITGPADGAVVDTATPTVIGTGEPGATVTVRDGATVLGTAVVAADGTWSLVPTTALSDGKHTLSATQTDPAGNPSPVSNAVTITVDTAVPAAPVITGPADGTVTDDNTPAVTGTGEPGATVTVLDGATVLGTAVIGPDGTWTLTPGTPLADGPHTFTATQADAAGNVSPVSNAVTITVDTAVPAAPVITGPADGTVTDDNTPTVTGTGEPGATVTVLDGATVLGTAVVGADGTWTLTPTTALSDGPHTLIATQVDPAGNASPASAPVGIVVDTAAPAAPVITGPTDGSATNDTTPPIVGTGEPGATVTVFEGTTTLGTAVVGSDGTWTLTPATPLAEGPHTLIATQTDPAGNTSPPSAPVTFTVDTTAPSAPVITGPADGTVTDDNTPTITGTGDPGDTITVRDGTTILGTAVVGADGTWTLTPTTALADGPHTLSATATDPAGNLSPTSDPVAIVVDTAAPAAPVITSPATGDSTSDTTPEIRGTGEPGATVTVREGTTVLGTALVGADGTWTLTPTTPLADGSHTITATQSDPAGNPSGSSDPVTFVVDPNAPAPPVITSPTTGSTTRDTTPPVTGTGEPGAVVTVLDGTTKLGTAVVGADGSWTLTPTTPLAEGPHTLTAIQQDAAGNVSPASDPVDFTVDTTAPPAPVITAPTAGSSTSDTTPPITGTGEPGAIVTVSDGSTKLGTAVVGPDGTWTLTPTTPLAQGPHTLTATQADPAGNVSPVSDPVTFTVDTTAPAAPVITGPADGTVTTDNTPTVTGTGEAGALVTIRAGDTVLGTARVASDGGWTFTPTTALSDGPHTFTAIQQDDAGNVSPASNPVTVTIDTTAPPPPKITGPTPGIDIPRDADTPEVVGTGHPRDIIDVLVDREPGCRTTVQDDGTWACTPNVKLRPGDVVFTATAMDPAGLVSDPDSVTVVKSPAEDLVLTSTVSDGDIAVGERSTITVTFVNLGPDFEPTATVTDPIGGPVRYVSDTASLGAYDAGTGVWTLGATAVDSTQTLAITVEGVQVGTADVGFTAAGTLAETQAANNTTRVAVRVVAAATPSLGVSGTATRTSTPAPGASTTSPSNGVLGSSTSDDRAGTAYTGVDSRLWLLAGSLLVVTGAALAFVTRRRRPGARH